MDFPAQLLAARTRRGLTQEQAAKLLGVSRRYLLEIEKGRAKPKAFEMEGMLAVLGKTASNR